jgi:hypothetical protein
MKRFTDRDDRLWDVVVGRASWGASYALFVPAGGSSADVRQAALGASSHEQAMNELDALDAAGLQALLDASTLKDG